MRKVILFLAALFLLMQTNKCTAQLLPTYTTPQFSRPNDPVGISLGLTGCAYRTGVVSVLSNPAGLAQLTAIELNVSHIPSHTIYFWSNEYFYNQEAVAIAAPLAKLGVAGLHFFNLNFGEVTTTDINGNNIDKGLAGIRQITFSLAKKFWISENSDLSIGLNLKYLDVYVISLNTTANLGDIGVRSWTGLGSYWLSIGITASNFGTKLQTEDLALPEGVNEGEDVYQLFRAGFAVGNSTERKNSIGYMATIEYQQNLKSAGYDEWKHLGCGSEINLFNHLYGRLGYSFDLQYKGDQKWQGWTYGFGFKTPEEINIIIPLTFELSYGRGVRRGVLDENVIALSIFYDLNPGH